MGQWARRLDRLPPAGRTPLGPPKGRLGSRKALLLAPPTPVLHTAADRTGKRSSWRGARPRALKGWEGDRRRLFSLDGGLPAGISCEGCSFPAGLHRRRRHLLSQSLAAPCSRATSVAQWVGRPVARLGATPARGQRGRQPVRMTGAGACQIDCLAFGCEAPRALVCSRAVLTPSAGVVLFAHFGLVNKVLAASGRDCPLVVSDPGA